MITQEEIIARLIELLELPIEETLREANELKSAFYALNHQLLEKQKLEHREIGAKMDDFIVIANPLEDTFKELFSKYRDNKAKHIHQKEEEEKKNLTEKQAVLKGLKDLIDNEENIGKSFDRFKDFQDRWKKLGAVPKETVGDLSQEYKAEIARFYYNITINKELKEYDLAKNLDLRHALVAKLEALESEEKIKDVEFILAAAKEQWDEAGPVKPEAFKGVNDRYFEALKMLHKKIQDFYSERKDSMESNLEAKKAMIARVLELTEEGHDSVGRWNKATDEVNKLREDWKSIGLVERKFNNQVWGQFKEAIDQFFDKKKAFFGEAREGFKENKEKKEKLIERAEVLKDSTDWKETTEALKRLQNDWKRIGSAGQRDENKLWGKFRGICDAFFKQKKEWFDGMDDRQTANLNAKEELLVKISATKLEGSKEESLEIIKALAADWAAIDHVPKNDIKRIASEYDKAIEKLYAQLKMNKEQVAKVRFKNKVERLVEGDNGADQLEREQHYIQKVLREKKDELLQYENNMAFFAKAKADNPLLINAQKNIAALKAEVEGYEEKLKLLRVSQRKLA